MKKTLLTGALSLLLANAASAETLRLLNWSDYIDETVLAQFEERYQVEVEYVSFDDELGFIEEFFRTEDSFDVVVPSDGLFSLLMSKDLLLPLNKSKITYYDQLDGDVMDQLAVRDPGNRYSIPYLWGTTGIGLNTANAPADAADLIEEHGWGVLFEEPLRNQFNSCGIATVYEREELFAAALRYLGYSINTTDSNALLQASLLLGEMAEDVRYMHSERYYEEIASGDVCLVLGYSGDILFQVLEDDTDSVQYFIPNQGTSMWFDVFAIPKTSKKAALAHQFINFLTQPQQAALNTEYNAYPNPLVASYEWIEADILNDPAIFPPPATMKRLEAFGTFEKKSLRQKRRYWVKDVCTRMEYCQIPLDIGY